MKIPVQALYDDGLFDLRLALVAGAAGLGRWIENPRIQKPGLAIAGLFQAIRQGHLQVLGNSEIEYLGGLQNAQRQAALAALLSDRVPCVVVTTGLEAPGDLLNLADAHSVPTFYTTLPSGTFINHAHAFLDEHISAEVTLHGVLLDVFGVGVVLEGQSGIGKSECALDLVLRGHALIGDDMVLIRQNERELIGMGSPVTRHHMEVRGLGIINVKDLFGAASVCERKKIELVVEMLEWHRDGDYDRLGLDESKTMILNMPIEKIRLPIQPGRNVASIVEVAARNHILKQQGHHGARRFKQTFEASLADIADGPDSRE